MARISNKAFLDAWDGPRSSKYRPEAEILFRRIRAIAPSAELSSDRTGIGFGRGTDGYCLVGMAIRADGLRYYANPGELAKHKTRLGKMLKGKCCVTLKRADDIDESLLRRITKASLTKPRMAA
jgi:hypothetical protein